MFPGGSMHNLVLIDKSRACTICGKPSQFGFSYPQ
jgi:hypothetical protein